MSKLEHVHWVSLASVHASDRPVSEDSLKLADDSGGRARTAFEDRVRDGSDGARTSTLDDGYISCGRKELVKRALTEFLPLYHRRHQSPVTKFWRPLGESICPGHG